MRRGERGDQRRSSQRYQSSTQIPIDDHGQIYLDPSGGDCDTEQGIDREDEESGFEVKTLTQNCLSMSHLFNEVFVPVLVTSITLHACTVISVIMQRPNFYRKYATSIFDSSFLLILS